MSSRPFRQLARTVVGALALGTLAALPTRAPAVDILTASGLPQIETLKASRDTIGLTSEQEQAIEKLMAAAREEAGPLEQSVRQHQDAFSAKLRDTKVTPADAETALAKLLDAEAAVKRLQLRTLIEVRKVLTAEQLQKLSALAPAGQAGPAGNMPPALAVKIERLKKSLETLGAPATPAMQKRGEEITTLLKEGKAAAAEAAADKLIADARLAEFEATPVVATDYSKFDPGDTDVPALQARFEAVSQKAKDVVSLPALRDLLRARDAFEDAKANQDATLVGRILTCAEQKVGLKPGK